MFKGYYSEYQARIDEARAREFKKRIAREDRRRAAPRPRDPLRAIVRAEWGNGEGYDTFAVEFSPEQDDESEALEK